MVTCHIYLGMHLIQLLPSYIAHRLALYHTARVRVKLIWKQPENIRVIRLPILSP